MGADEEGTLAALKAIRRTSVDPRIVERRRRIIKTTGNGLLVEFASVVDAVRRAIEDRSISSSPRNYAGLGRPLAVPRLLFDYQMLIGHRRNNVNH